MTKKQKDLLLSLLYDGIGMLSFVFPGLGEFMDIVWAPLSAYIIIKMYKGTVGKVAGLLSFGEEAGFFGTDIIPTFTLAWIYEYYIKKEDKKEESVIGSL